MEHLRAEDESSEATSQEVHGFFHFVIGLFKGEGCQGGDPDHLHGFL